MFSGIGPRFPVPGTGRYNQRVPPARVDRAADIGRIVLWPGGANISFRVAIGTMPGPLFSDAPRRLLDR
ncbi:hypothetical protein [Stratiformator vulcanicus]|uniref:hypothetical protein n=1 Tax=Stratiformator vulcanicus TaxID=2527980 RepID=UPI0011AA8B22|nr:hypothetical protein [Stratiformator vulcanicus]